jgi:hypothetical protein
MQTITVEDFEKYADGDTKVCVYCDTLTTLWYCKSCHEYKGLMTIEDWEQYTGEVWEE